MGKCFLYPVCSSLRLVTSGNSSLFSPAICRVYRPLCSRLNPSRIISSSSGICILVCVNDITILAWKLSYRRFTTVVSIGIFCNNNKSFLPPVASRDWRTVISNSSGRARSAIWNIDANPFPFLTRMCVRRRRSFIVGSLEILRYSF